MHLLDREAARKVGVDRKTRDPGQPVARKDQRPRITLFTRHSRVDKDVLQLAGAAAPEGAHPKPGSPVAHTQLKSPLKVYRFGVVAAGAAPHLEARRVRGGAPRRDDFHVVPHDTETQGPWKVDASASPARTGKPQHRLHLRTR